MNKKILTLFAVLLSFCCFFGCSDASSEGTTDTVDKNLLSEDMSTQSLNQQLYTYNDNGVVKAAIKFTGFRMTVLYKTPADPAAFDSHYANVHVPLTVAVPGIRAFTYGKLATLDGSPSPYYFSATIYLDSANAFNAMLATPQAQAALADVPNLGTPDKIDFVTGDETTLFPIPAFVHNTLRTVLTPRLYNKPTVYANRLFILYGTPTNPTAFVSHYNTVHVALALGVPGIKEFDYGQVSTFPDPSVPGPFFVAEVMTDNAAQMQQMLATPQAAAAIADVPNFATGGATFLTGDNTVIFPDIQ